jgi:hypothetical protein
LTLQPLLGSNLRDLAVPGNLFQESTPGGFIGDTHRLFLQQAVCLAQNLISSGVLVGVQHANARQVDEEWDLGSS